MILKPIKYKKAYEDVIANTIIVWLWANVFQECFIILKNNVVDNAGGVLIDEIYSGNIFYQGGAFYSLKTRFSNSQSVELERIGAKYSKYRQAYVISEAKLPNDIRWAIETAKAKTAGKAIAIKTFLANQLGQLAELQKKLVFDGAVNAIMQDLQERVYKNAKMHKIELITPKIDDFMGEQIAKRYTDNLNFWIKGWTEEKIVEMREVVGQMSIEGKGTKTISDYLAKEFGVAQSKARFLARNETAIATTSYLSAKYEQEGFSKFKWITRLDGRERPLHRELNGQIFRFDNPPIIDERTGQRGLPSQTYNCRCSFSPVADREWLENRKKLFKANNSLIDKIISRFKK